MSPTSYQAAPPRITYSQLRPGGHEVSRGQGRTCALLHFPAKPPSGGGQMAQSLCCPASTGSHPYGALARNLMEVPLFRPRSAVLAALAFGLLLAPSAVLAAAEV